MPKFCSAGRGLARERCRARATPGGGKPRPYMLVALLLALTLGRANAQEAPPTPCSHVERVCTVAVQPFGDVDDETVQAVAGGLQSFYGFHVTVLDPVEHPDEAWYEPRRRWRAERLLAHLRASLPEGADRIIGVTEADISTTKGEHEDWGILGLANMPGRAAVVSLFRCRRRVADVPPLERLRRVAIHELGHTLGLPHCPTEGCFLMDGGGSVETVDRETFLCEDCRTGCGGGGWPPPGVARARTRVGSSPPGVAKARRYVSSSALRFSFARRASAASRSPLASSARSIFSRAWANRSWEAAASSS